MKTTENQIQQMQREPEWMRLQVRGRDPLFGLTRPYYYDLIKKGRIKTVCLREPGKTTGVRLVNVASVREYIERHVEEAAVC